MTLRWTSEELQEYLDRRAAGNDDNDGRDSTAEVTPPPPMNEKELQQAVEDLARALGWLVYHTRDSRRSEPGYPDLTMVRGDRLIFVELKSAGRTPTDAQKRWLQALADAGAEAYVWRPAAYPDDARLILE